MFVGHGGRDWAKANVGVSGIHLINEAMKVGETTETEQKGREDPGRESSEQQH